MSNSKKKPFPWKCQNCREKAVTEAVIPYETDFEYDGRTYHLALDQLRVPRCDRCGFVQLDCEAHEAIADELRKKVGLLAPREIRGYREDLELTQKEFAAAVGISEATVSRWENGFQIQQKSLDNLMRIFFGRSDVRKLMIEQKLGQLSYQGNAHGKRCAAATAGDVRTNAAGS